MGGSYRPSPWRIRVIRDPKVRVITAPEVRDRVVHRALLDEIGPSFERSFVATSFAVGHGRGAHRAALRYLTWMRRYRYRLSLDVRQYFPSIHQPTLLALFARRLRDADTLELIERLLAAGGAVYRTEAAEAALDLEVRPHPADRGLALGSYLSQWCGGMYLDGLDHFVLRELKIDAYQRYMDDFALFADDRDRLLAARDAIGAWLDQQRKLRLNPKRWHVVATTEPSVYLGYRFTRSGITPSRKLRRRFEQRILAAAEHGGDALRRTLVSYRGLLTF